MTREKQKQAKTHFKVVTGTEPADFRLAKKGRDNKTFYEKDDNISRKNTSEG